MLLPVLLCLTPRLAELEAVLLCKTTLPDAVERACAELCASMSDDATPALSPLIQGAPIRHQAPLREGAFRSNTALTHQTQYRHGSRHSGPLILPAGEWELLHTSKSSFDPRAPLGSRSDLTAPGLEAMFPGASQAIAASASPIQRAVLDSFAVTQRIELSPASSRVTQTVELPGGARLVLAAAARVSPDAPRRISFRFHEGYISTRGGLRLPYPVPFRLLPEAEASGWLDTLFLSDRLRISVGNKGAPPPLPFHSRVLRPRQCAPVVRCTHHPPYSHRSGTTFVLRRGRSAASS